jgi:hypothetical protein
VITSERSGAGSYSSAIAKVVDQQLRKAGAGVPFTDVERLDKLKPKSCNGNGACLQKLAAALGNDGVLVSVDVGKLGSKLVIHLEALSQSGSLESVDLGAAASSWQLDLSGPISLFASALAQKMQPPAATAPPTSAIAPPPPAATPLVAAAPPEKSTPWGAWTLLALGVASVGTSVGFGVDGLSAKSQYDNSFLTNGMPFTGPDGRPASHLSQLQLNALQNRGNTSFTVAVISGAAGVVLLALSLWLFLSN